MQDPIRITLTVVDDDDDLEPEEAEEKGSEENRTGEKVSREALGYHCNWNLIVPQEGA